MNLNKIKEKYKQILEQNQPNSAESEDEWELAYSRMKNKRRKHILTQSHCINRSTVSLQPQTDEQKFLKVKQKLAQSIANLNKKDLQIEELKTLNIKAKQQVKMLEEQVNHLKQEVAESQQKIVQQKVAYGCIEKSMENISKTIQSQKMDKELLQRQIEYYQSQIQSLKKQQDLKDSQLDELKSQIKNVEKYKNINTRLREDIARLRQLLSETEKYKVFATKIEYKNYIARPCKQHECWISQDIVQDVQSFLRKHKISSSNKQFTNSLIKFVTKNVESARIQGEKKAKKYYNSKLKDNQRRQNHSMNIMQIREQELKKTVLSSSMIKSRRNTNVLNESKIFGESFIHGGLQKSHAFYSLNKNRDVCLEILASFRKGIVDLLETRQFKKKKIMKLVDWVIEGIMAIFPKEKAVGGDFRLQTEEIKITL